MSPGRHPQFALRKLAIGHEQAPLLVIDNLLSNADELVDIASRKPFGDVTSYYPGVRAKAPLSYQQFVLQELRDVFIEFFALPGPSLRMTSCHFSLVTSPPGNLAHLQCIPHVDSLLGTELAFIHYLFKDDLGGTAFYRHRHTGFEVIDQERKAKYFAQVEVEKLGSDAPPVGYINGSTALYEQVAAQDGIFNRMLVYRRNSLHSGNLGPQFVADANPRSGRLSVNGFIA
jgi:hypothetical protein